MHIELEDRDGQLLHMPKEEAAVQAPIEMTPSRVAVAKWVSLW